jgi:hypothetical protein
VYKKNIFGRKKKKKKKKKKEVYLLIQNFESKKKKINKNLVFYNKSSEYRQLGYNM